MDIKPTRALAAAVNAMCERNERTRGAVAGDVLLGASCVLVILKRPIIIDGELVDEGRSLNSRSHKRTEVSILDLIDDWHAAHMSVN